MTLLAENDPTQAVKGASLPVKVTDRAAITDEKVFGQFLRDLEAYAGAGVIKDALLFRILTMTRPGEVRGVTCPRNLPHFSVEFAEPLEGANKCERAVSRKARSLG